MLLSTQCEYTFVAKGEPVGSTPLTLADLTPYIPKELRRSPLGTPLCTHEFQKLSLNPLRITPLAKESVWVKMIECHLAVERKQRRRVLL